MSIDGFLYSKSTTKLSKTNNPLRYKTILDPRHQSDQDRLVSSQEKNTNPTQGVDPLSRDSQDMESAQSVNKKIHRIFASIFGSVHASLADPLTLSFLLRFFNHIPYVE